MLNPSFYLQKAASGGGSANPIAEPPSTGSFLYDRSRFGPDPSHSSGPQDRREGRRRNPHNWGGPTIEDVHQNVHRGRKGRQQQVCSIKKIKLLLGSKEGGLMQQMLFFLFPLKTEMLLFPWKMT